MSIEFLNTLQGIVKQRINEGTSDNSYTAQLIEQGITRIAQKIGEEGVEVALAAATGATDDALLGETADLMYHLIVLLTVRDLSLNDVCAVLDSRHLSTV